LTQHATGAQTEALSLTNKGTIVASAGANVSAFEATYIEAVAQATGVNQLAHGLGAGSSASASLDNSGNIVAVANAKAGATLSEYELAVADVFGVQQGAFVAQNASVSLTNSKLISVAANATVTGLGPALGIARAVGLSQSASGSNLNGSAVA